jgi:hypothetical protein
MKMTWPICIVLISFVLMGVIKMDEQKQFYPYFKAQKSYKLHRFEAAKTVATPQELDLLELWESMLTGRSAPVSKWIKAQYKILGLNHLFTPSGFHLSAVMMPFMKLIKNKQYQFGILFLIGLGVFSLVGQGALKRMVLIKLNQNLFGQKSGFILALLMDMLFGSFSESPLSFCYSFLFLGIIYSGRSLLFLWFFFAQSLIAYFSGDHISPLIMVLSPLLNIAFALAMPLLFLLALPLCGWQIKIGLIILSGLQKLVEMSAKASQFVPSWEINVGVLLCFVLLYFRKRKSFALALFCLTCSLNQDHKRIPGPGRYDYIPREQVLKIVSSEVGETVYFGDGKCKRELVRGIWWEKCSPRRRSKKSKIKKLSSL